jgi:hypothetical protein
MKTPPPTPVMLASMPMKKPNMMSHHQSSMRFSRWLQFLFGNVVNCAY